MTPYRIASPPPETPLKLPIQWDWLPATFTLACVLMALALAAVLSGCEDSRCRDEITSLNICMHSLSNSSTCMASATASTSVVDNCHILIRCTCPVRDGGR